MKLVRALANPTRIRILEAVAQGPTTAERLAEVLDENLGVIVYHMEVLRTTGCIEFTEGEQVGGAAGRSYDIAPSATPTRHLAPPRLVQSGFGHPPAAVVQSIVERSMPNPGTDVFGDGKDQLSCASFVVDAQGWREISAAIAEAMDRIATAHEESTRRLNESDDDERIGATIAVASFEESPRRRAA